MSLSLQVKRTSQIALYLQIAEQIKDQICNNRLPPGSRLPTIRQLSEQLQVTRVTIQNAYDELQSNGWIEATIGRGTYVADPLPAHLQQRPLAQQVTTDAVISDILQMNEAVGVRSLASASPDPNLFPADEFWQVLDELRPDMSSVVSYGASQGVPALRVALSKLLHDRGVDVLPDDILVTVGVTQGMSLVMQVLCRPGDCVLVEQPTYLGFLHSLKAHNIQPISVPLDEEGPDLAVLERLALQHRPRFFYTVPTFQNPTGICMSLTRRRELLALAARCGFLLVEDDIYARLAYDQPVPPPLYALDETHSVIYLCGFSKNFMPSLRLGYLVAPPPLYQKLLSLRRAGDLCSPALLQYALARFLENGGFKRHLRRVLPLYRERRDVCMAALQHTMPPAVSWTRPSGGFCTWVTLPNHHGLTNLYQMAIQHGWLFAPGDAFLADASVHQHLRICFGHQPPATIRTGIDVLSHLIRQCLDQNDRRNLEPRDWTPLV